MVHWKNFRARSKSLFVEQWLLISYFVAALIALTWPAPGKAVAEPKVAGVSIVISINIIIVFFISGLVLKTEDIKVAFKAPLGMIWGTVSSLLITPCLGFGYREISLTPPAFTAGITLLCCVPMTLGIGLSLVRSCGGNEGLALFLTVVTNLLGIFSMPLWLKALFSGSEFNLSFDLGKMIAKLVITVMLPSLIGKAVRELSAHAQKFTRDHKTFLGMFSTFQLAFIVWQVLSTAQENVVNTPFETIVFVVLLVCAQHIIYLIFNFLITTFVLRLSLLENVATGIMSAQKSGPVSVALITYLTPDVATQGIMSIPAVLGQLCQVFIGQLVLVPIFSPRTKKFKAEQEAKNRLPSSLPHDSSSNSSSLDKAADSASRTAGTDSTHSSKTDVPVPPVDHGAGHGGGHVPAAQLPPLERLF